jgi:hypothetical protein
MEKLLSKWILKTQNIRMSIMFSWSNIQTSDWVCEQDNESYGCIRVKKFLIS